VQSNDDHCALFVAKRREREAPKIHRHYFLFFLLVSLPPEPGDWRLAAMKEDSSFIGGVAAAQHQARRININIYMNTRRLGRQAPPRWPRAEPSPPPMHNGAPFHWWCLFLPSALPRAELRGVKENRSVKGEDRYRQIVSCQLSFCSAPLCQHAFPAQHCSLCPMIGLHWVCCSASGARLNLWCQLLLCTTGLTAAS